jgi:hypothetical protein
MKREWIVWCVVKQTNAYVSEGIGFSSVPLCRACGRMIYNGKHPKPHYFCGKCGKEVKPMVTFKSISKKMVKGE